MIILPDYAIDAMKCMSDALADIADETILDYASATQCARDALNAVFRMQNENTEGMTRQ